MRGKECSMKENIRHDGSDTTNGSSEPEGNVNPDVEVGAVGSSSEGGDYHHHHHHDDHSKQQPGYPKKPRSRDSNNDVATSLYLKLAVNVAEKTTTTPGPSSPSVSLIVVDDEDVGQRDPILEKPKNNTSGGNHLTFAATRKTPSVAADKSTSTTTNNNNNNNNRNHLEQYYRQLDDDLEVNVEPIPTSNNNNAPHNQQQASAPGAYALASGVSPGMGSLRDSQQSGTTTEESRSTAASSNNYNYNNNTNNNEDGLLAEALPVNEQDIRTMFPTGTLEEAQPVQEQAAARGVLQKNKDRIQSRSLLTLVFLVVVACLVVLTLSLAFGLSKSSSSGNEFDIEMPTPTTPITRPLPPMENLEVLYEELPPKTRDSLSNNNSPQYLAWEWLHNHPNITTYPEWRKKQIFAMVTFYHSFGGPNWPESTPSFGRWMDYNTSECSWIMKGKEVNYFHQQSLLIFGPVYTVQDLQPCNSAGELQTILLPKLSIKPTTTASDIETPSVPAEISLLTSLKIVAILHSKLGNARLAEDIMIPELIQLPNLIHLSLQGSDARGTIPKDISQMTNLVRLSFGANRLSGTVPPQLARMTYLEQLILEDIEGITGVLPSELGLMTSLTSLEVARNSFTGQIPTELGDLTLMKRLCLGGNQELTGTLPNQLWELSHMEKLLLFDLPNLHGSIPSTDIDIMRMMPNLTTLHLDGSPHLSGTFPDQVCLSVEELEFDCSDSLCGCDDCPCNVDYHHHSGSGHNNTQTPAAVWNKSLP